MKFPCNVSRGDRLSQMVIACFTDSLSDEKQQEIHEKIQDGGKYDVVLTIEGIEVDLEAYVKEWQKEVDYKIEDRVMEIVSDRLSDQLEVIEEQFGTFAEELRGTIRATIHKAAG